MIAEATGLSFAACSRIRLWRRFTNYNVGVHCTPSRSAIMTAQHPVCSGTTFVRFPGQGESGLVPR